MTSLIAVQTMEVKYHGQIQHFRRVRQHLFINRKTFILKYSL